MLYLELLLLCAFSPFLLCSSAKVKPRAQQAAAGSEAFWEIHNVMLRAQTYPGARNAQIARPRNEASVPAGGAISESPFAAIKRTLLGTRGFYCDPGYGLCSCELPHTSLQQARCAAILTAHRSHLLLLHQQ